MNFGLSLRVVVGAAAVLSVGTAVPRLGAQSTQKDSAKVRRWVTKRDAVAASAAVLATLAIAPFDSRIALAMQGPRLQESDDLQHSARDFAFMGGPGPFLVGTSLYLAGRITGASRLADAGLHMTEAVLLAASITGLGKGISGRALPSAGVHDSENFQLGRGFHDRNGPFVSFPSGHAAASFAMASVLTGEAERWQPGMARLVGPIAYGTAGLVGIARMYQNVHWASDLPLAAVIGTWSGLTVVARSHRVRQSDAQVGDLTSALDQVLRSTTVAPIAGRGLGLSWSMPLELGSRPPAP